MDLQKQNRNCSACKKAYSPLCIDANGRLYTTPNWRHLIARKETHLGQDIDGQKALKLDLKTHQNAQTEKAGKILHQ